MNQRKQEQLMQGQTGIAKKVYDCVPIAESWSVSLVMTQLRRQTGSAADSRIVAGCLTSLAEAGLIRKTGPNAYQRLPIEPKTSQEPQMAGTTKKNEQKVEPSSAATPLDLLGDLASEIGAVADQMKRLAARVEDAALAVEQEREMTAKDMAAYRQLKALLKSLQGEAV